MTNVNLSALPWSGLAEQGATPGSPATWRLLATATPGAALAGAAPLSAPTGASAPTFEELFARREAASQTSGAVKPTFAFSELGVFGLSAAVADQGEPKLPAIADELARGSAQLRPPGEPMRPTAASLLSPFAARVSQEILNPTSVETRQSPREDAQSRSAAQLARLRAAPARAPAPQPAVPFAAPISARQVGANAAGVTVSSPAAPNSPTPISPEKIGAVASAPRVAEASPPWAQPATPIPPQQIRTDKASMAAASPSWSHGVEIEPAPTLAAVTGARASKAEPGATRVEPSAQAVGAGSLSTEASPPSPEASTPTRAPAPPHADGTTETAPGRGAPAGPAPQPRAASKAPQAEARSDAEINLVLAEQDGEARVAVAAPALGPEAEARLRQVADEVAADFGVTLTEFTLNGAALARTPKLIGAQDAGRFTH